MFFLLLFPSLLLCVCYRMPCHFGMFKTRDRMCRNRNGAHSFIYKSLIHVWNRSQSFWKFVDFFYFGIMNRKSAIFSSFVSLFSFVLCFLHFLAQKKTDTKSISHLLKASVHMKSYEWWATFSIDKKVRRRRRQKKTGWWPEKFGTENISSEPNWKPNCIKVNPYRMQITLSGHGAKWVGPSAARQWRKKK